ncbi:8053_t:CDS:2, partial [Paraglomus brasilianum]
MDRRTLVHLENLNDQSAVTKATNAVNEYYYHTLKHPSHRSDEFWSNFIEHFGMLLLNLKPLSDTVNRFLHDNCGEMYMKLRNLSWPFAPKLFELPKNDTEINPKVSDSRSENASASETSISENSEDIIPQSQEIPNMTPYLAQRENNMSSLVESNSQIPIGGIGAILVMASISTKRKATDNSKRSLESDAKRHRQEIFEHYPPEAPSTRATPSNFARLQGNSEKDCLILH